MQCRVVAQCTFEATTVWTALRERPDLVIVICNEPTPDALDAVQMIPRLQPRTRILILTDRDDEARLTPWRSCSFDAIVAEHGGPPELGVALDMVLSGKRYISESIRKVLFNGGDRPQKPVLSQREAELLPLLASGMALREAAEKMAVAYKTADCYRTSLFRKLGLHDRVDLARYAIRENIIRP
ncbi:MAG: response regulator transcription factor [Phycisphaerae bacterium]|nr:response regulator transcription factor [Phycisphaerae bacterium]